MDKSQDKIYNLEDRTLNFAKSIRDLIKLVPKNLTNIEYCKQLARSSASIGANYMEANESISKKDLRMEIGFSRKEAKESKYWLELLDSEEENQIRLSLLKEALELTKIFSAIQRKIKI
ncbi:MAG: four helix bundle protein [Candidatus Doudnabacteria bacterium]|nr:four helix bundle protein [Candidatus Doudnabacteria bacterium]